MTPTDSNPAFDCPGANLEAPEYYLRAPRYLEHAMGCREIVSKLWKTTSRNSDVWLRNLSVWHAFLGVCHTMYSVWQLGVWLRCWGSPHLVYVSPTQPTPLPAPLMLACAFESTSSIGIHRNGFDASLIMIEASAELL